MKIKFKTLKMLKKKKTHFKSQQTMQQKDPSPQKSPLVNGSHFKPENSRVKQDSYNTFYKKIS